MTSVKSKPYKRKSSSVHGAVWKCYLVHTVNNDFIAIFVFQNGPFAYVTEAALYSSRALSI